MKMKEQKELNFGNSRLVFTLEKDEHVKVIEKVDKKILAFIAKETEIQKAKGTPRGQETAAAIISMLKKIEKAL